MGHALICNRPDNGLAAIEQFGAEHLRTGALILYTSQDSVLQLAAHVDRVPSRRSCTGVRGCARGDERRARGRPRDRAAVQRHARARSSASRAGATSRCARPRGSYLRSSRTRAWRCTAVGKVDDLFAGAASTRRTRARATRRRSRASTQLLGRLERRARVREPDRDRPALRPPQGRRTGSHGALGEIDAYLAGMLARAARGRPAGRDRRSRGRPRPPRHRPHARVCAAARAHRRDGAAARGRGRLGGVRHDGPLADVGASVLRWLAGAEAPRRCPGSSFIS